MNDNVLQWYKEDYLGGFQLGGFNLIEEVNALNPQFVVDVGCAHNLFKGKIRNLIGFDRDPFPGADLQCSTVDMPLADNSIDVTLCLGSLIYGNREDWTRDLEHIVRWTKPGGRIIVRIRPFSDYVGHNEEIVKHIWQDQPRWSWEDFHNFTNVFGLEIEKPVQLDQHTTKPALEKVSWWWRKK
jgi:SAM-dependent methyltransferase